MSKTEFLFNIPQKDIPTKDSVDYDDFWDNEMHKAEYGLTVDGVYISGWLYWHCAGLWTIFDDIEDPINNAIKRKSMKPSFRVNEWMIAVALEEAQAKRKGVMIFGSRRLGKSEFISSFVSRSSTLFQGSENVVMGGNWGDIDIVMEKVVWGLNKLPEYFKFGRLSENLRKQIELGLKDKKGERLSWSKIICRNHEEGNKPSAAEGITPTTFIIDEIGKSPFAQVLAAAKPSFTSKFGWRCSPILTGTSGDIKKNSDAQAYFENPEANNFIYRDLIEESNKRVGVFISGLYRMEGKVDKNIGDYIENEKGILIPKESELYKIPMQVKDDAKANAVIDEELRIAALSPDPGELLKATMYYPKNTKDLFLSDDGNNFPIEALKEHLIYLQQNDNRYFVKLYRDASNKVIISEQTNKKPIDEFPLKDFVGYKKDACVIIYEYPEPDPPAYLYLAGCDPYNVSSSKWSSSLGSFFVYKRIYDPVAGTFQRRIVAEYTARPEDMITFYETVEMLMEVYNAVCMPESEASGFLQYFDLRNKGHWLADGWSMLKEISPNTSVSSKRNKGLPAVPRVQRHYKELVYNYLTEKIIMTLDNESEPITKMGLVRIPSIGLVKELIAFTEDGNYDRYVAFGHTLEHELWSYKVYPYVEAS
jgi:hypothetical protein